MPRRERGSGSGSGDAESDEGALRFGIVGASLRMEKGRKLSLAGTAIEPHLKFLGGLAVDWV